MSTREQLAAILDLVEQHHPQSDTALIRHAFELAKTPPASALATAHIVAQRRLDPPAIAACLVHESVFAGDVAAQEVIEQLGTEVAAITEGLVRMRSIRWDRLEEEAAESLRKLFLAIAADIRVVIIAVARRVYTMRTLAQRPAADRERIAAETMEIFAPLANRLGLWHLKSELEDRAFEALEPGAYGDIRTLLERGQGSRQEFLAALEDALVTRLRDQGLEAELSGRSKHVFSIHKKMQRKGVEFEQVYDVAALRIIVGEVADCYAVLGLIHGLWTPIPGEFDDYIAKPKDNFYRSLHTAAVGPGGHPVEIQIRTRDMHEFAEHGIAAHWQYKEGRRRDDGFDRKIAWIRQLMQWQKELADPREFVESLKTDVFQDQVYVFTPGGDVIDLPTGSTPLDFAYRIHTEVGHRCRGAQVNGQIVQLTYELKTGDRVKIQTTKTGGPSRDWLSPQLGYTRTAGARQKIRAWFRAQSRDTSITQGREALERELRRIGMEGKRIADVAELMGYDKPDDLLARLGFGDESLHRVASRLLESERGPSPVEVPSEPKAHESIRADVMVGDIDGVLSHPAKCCSPVPGDPAIGFITRGRGISIHRRDCPNIRSHPEPDRLMPITWGASPNKVYPVRIRVLASDRPGLLRDIADVITLEGVSLSSADVSTNREDLTATINATLEVRESGQLVRILSKLENLAYVVHARRVRG